MAEDPVEDVFVTNVETPEGNRRVFEGTWGANDYFVQVVIDILDSRQAPQECRNLLLPAFALLKPQRLCCRTSRRATMAC